MGKVRPRCFVASDWKHQINANFYDSCGFSKNPTRSGFEWRRALEDVFNRFRQQELANGAVKTSLDFGDSHVDSERLPKTFFERSMNIYSNLTFEAKLKVLQLSEHLS